MKVRFLRTGDAGFLHEGILYISSRLKDTIIIHGCNYNPWDIELTVSQSHSDINSTGTAAFAVEIDGIEKLVIVQEVKRVMTKKINSDEIIAKIRSNVQERHALQVYAVVLVISNSIPKTTSGKVQRILCKQKFLENKLKIIFEWKNEYLHDTKNIGENSNNSKDHILMYLIEIINKFIGNTELEFDYEQSLISLGIDSIIAVKLNNNIKTKYEIDIPIVKYLEGLTINGLVSLIANSNQSNFKINQQNHSTEKSKINETEGYPLSSSQKKVWIINQIDSKSWAYNINGVFLLKGNLDVFILNKSFKILIDRHESLRTKFMSIDGEPRQSIIDDIDFNIFFINISSSDKEISIEKIIQEEIKKGFNLNKAPLIRVVLIKANEHEHVLLCMIHHIICDGWSVNIIFKELMVVYNSLITNSKYKLPEIKLQSKDYAVSKINYLDSVIIKNQLNYWKSIFSDCLPKMSFPYDYERPQKITFEGKNKYFYFDEDISNKLRIFARKKCVTLSTLFYSIYTILLNKICNQDDLVIGAMTAGRIDCNIENTVGMFCNYLPVRTKITPEETIDTFLKKVDRNMLDAFENQEYPFENLAEEIDNSRHINRNPFFDTMIIFHNELENGFNTIKNKTIGFNDLDIEILDIEEQGAVIDFKLDIYDCREKGFKASFQYNSSLLKTQTIHWMISKLNKLIDCIVLNENILINNIELITSDEYIMNKRKLLKNKEVNELERTSAKVLISATFNTDLIAEIINSWCNHFNIDLELTITPYNQVFQEILNPESQTSKNNDINILLVRFCDWLRFISFKTDVEIIENLNINYNNLIESIKILSQNSTLFVCILPYFGHIINDNINSYLEIMTSNFNKAMLEISSVNMIDIKDMTNFYSISEIFDMEKDKIGHLPFTDQYFMGLGTFLARKIIMKKKEAFKVIVLDCDNTLWKGQIGEDGIENIIIDGNYINFQNCVLELMQKGFLLAICSKNNEKDINNVLEKHSDMILKNEHFVAKKINWRPKSQNIIEISKELNLSLGSFIFIDDNETECLEVAENCQDVLVLPFPKDPKLITYFIFNTWAFDKMSVTKEDKIRTSMYQAEIQRKIFKTQKESFKKYLNELGLKVNIRKICENDFIRISQLTERTNQFNMNSIKCSEQEINNISKDTLRNIWIIESEDRFGSYGIIGTVITNRDSNILYLDRFMLSCRVLGRGIELAIFEGLKRFCDETGITKIMGLFIETGKNYPFKEFIEKSNWISIMNKTSTEIEFEVDVNSFTYEANYIELSFNEDNSYIDEPVEYHDVKPIEPFIKHPEIASCIDIKIYTPIMDMIKNKVKHTEYYAPYEYFPVCNLNELFSTIEKETTSHLKHLLKD